MSVSIGFTEDKTNAGRMWPKEKKIIITSSGNVGIIFGEWKEVGQYMPG